MTILSKPVSSNPLGKRRALLIAIRHVRRNAGSGFDNLDNLKFAHRDAMELRDRLIASHRYEADDIILMIDDKRHPKHLWPTRAKILCQINRLVNDAPEDGHLFFYFSGHCIEVEAAGEDRARMRANGQEEEIVCADGKPILDYTLHDRLIKPLERVKGAKLFALFDCCHSESLLDLQKGSGPNCYSKVWKIGRDQMFKDLATAVCNFWKTSKNREKRNNIPPAPRRVSSKLRRPPTCETKEVGELDVICLSACRDGQLAHDDCEQGLTFTQCFLNAIAAKPNASWTELRNALKELILGIRTSYEEAYLQGPSSENDGTHKPWMQEPRYCTGVHKDLGRSVSF